MKKSTKIILVAVCLIMAVTILKMDDSLSKKTASDDQSENQSEIAVEENESKGDLTGELTEKKSELEIAVNTDTEKKSASIQIPPVKLEPQPVKQPAPKPVKQPAPQVKQPVKQLEPPAPQPVKQPVEQPVTRSTPEVSRGTSRSDQIYADKIFWLARIIQAEAGGESDIGKVAVGNVVLNRVNSSKFPNTIYSVIFDVQGRFTQFSPVLDGSIYNNPAPESITAAKAALNGARPVGTALYFLNPRKATVFWIPNNREFMKTIGGHDFYY